MNKKEITCVILSGGKSSRMGQDKALLTINGQRFVDLIAKRLSFARDVLFSVRDENDFPEINLPHIADEYPGCGPLAGIHSALKHAKTPWVFVVACDTPFITESVIDQMLKYCAQNSLAIIPKEQDGRLHVLSAIYHKDLLPRLEKQLKEGNFRVRQVMDYEFTTYIPVEEFKQFPNVFRNINTMEDYKEVLSL